MDAIQPEYSKHLKTLKEGCCLWLFHLLKQLPLIPWFYCKHWRLMTLISTPGCRRISYPGSGLVVSKHFKFSRNFQPLLIPNLLIQVVLHIGQYLFFIEPDHLFNRNIWQCIHFVQNLLELGILTKETFKTLVFDLIPFCSDNRLFKVCDICCKVGCSLLGSRAHPHGKPWRFLISDTGCYGNALTQKRLNAEMPQNQFWGISQNKREIPHNWFWGISALRRFCVEVFP